MEINYFASLYSYVLSEFSIEGNARLTQIGNYYLYTDYNTKIDSCVMKNRQMVILGDIVNVYDGSSKDISRTILLRGNDINSIIECEREYGGKYIIFYINENSMYILGDATCSIPIMYAFINDKIVCSSNGEWIAKNFNLNESTDLLKIRRKSDISQAMPGDVSTYSEIKQLLPNHYISISDRKSIRYINSNEDQKKISIEDAVEYTDPLICNMLKYYDSQYDIYCPITSGRDSRVVLAYLSKYSKKTVYSYTIQHDQFSPLNQEIEIPRKLSSLLNVSHEVIQDETIPDNIKEYFDNLLGKDKYSFRTLRIAYTILKHYSNGAIVNGDIIGQVGKCSLHRDIPNALATPRYFRCKMHNYSNESLKIIADWLSEIKISGEKVNVFDLFSVENRLGRWASQENLIYNEMGQRYFNIFNSRSIIYTWTAVARKDRKKSLIQRGLIKKIQPVLLKIPFEQDSLIAEISKLNGVTYYIASMVKYMVQKIIFFIRKKR